MPFAGDAGGQMSCPNLPSAPSEDDWVGHTDPCGEKPLIVWIKTFTLFVLSPGVENPAAQAGIDCSFCASDTRLRRGPGQDRTALVV